MLSETWGIRERVKRKRFYIKTSNAPPVCTDEVVTSCLKPRPALPQLSSEAQRWWRMNKYSKSGLWTYLLIAGEHRPRCPHNGGIMQGGFSLWRSKIIYLRHIPFPWAVVHMLLTQKLLRSLSWGEGSVPSHRQDPGRTPGGWRAAALLTGPWHAGVTARPSFPQHLSAVNFQPNDFPASEFSTKSA